MVGIPLNADNDDRQLDSSGRETMADCYRRHSHRERKRRIGIVNPLEGLVSGEDGVRGTRDHAIPPQVALQFPFSGGRASRSPQLCGPAACGHFGLSQRNLMRRWVGRMG